MKHFFSIMVAFLLIATTQITKGQTYTVTFDKQLGTGGSSTATVTLNSNMPSGLTAPTRTGYTFGGYYDATSGGTQYYTSSMGSVRTWNKSQNATLYARWTLTNYTVTFHYQGGSAYTTSVSATYGNAMPYGGSAPTKTGYTFTGYYDASSGGTQYYTASMASARTWDKTTNFTLFAQWTASTYTITFNKTANGSGGINSVSATYGSAMPSAVAPTRDLCTFAGYYDVAITGGKQYYSSTMASANIWDKTQNTTLYAQWKGKITYDANGGSGSNFTQDVVIDAYNTLSNGSGFTKTGYTLSKWKHDQTGNTYGIGTSQNIGSSVKLLAQWTAKTFKVTFNVNDSYASLPSGTTNPITVTYDAAYVTFPTPIHSQAGYIFDGWYTAATGGTPVTNTTTVNITADQTLYAHWTAPPTCTISFNNNVGSGSMSNQIFTKDKPQSIKPNTFTKSGSTFARWNTNSSGTGTSYNDGDSYTHTGNTSTTFTLFAQWNAVTTYAISFNANLGAGTMTNQTFTQNVSEAIKPNTFTRTGYTFTGWNTLANGSGTAYTDGQVTSFSAITPLYAQWTPVATATYTIRFDPNGTGTTGTMPDQIFTQSVSKAISSNLFVREGYTFAGWNNQANGLGSNSYTDGQVTPFSANTTLYAKWTANPTYTLTFDKNGGSGIMPPQPFVQGVYQNLNTNLYTQPGYTFAGWATTAGGAVVYPDNDWIKISTPTTLFAKWTANPTYAVSFNGNNGTGTMPNQNVVGGLPTKLNSNLFVRTGYTFAGWSLSQSGALYYTDGQFATIDAPTPLYALWIAGAPTTYTVSFNSNGGTGTMAAQPFTEGMGQNITPNTFSRTGYTFTGWNTEANGSGTAYSNGQNTSFSVAKTLYAQWSAVAPTTYTLSFNANLGTGTMTPQTFTQGIGQNINANTFTRTGYVFMGWATSAGGTVVYTNSQSIAIATNTPIYAVWQITPPTVTTNGVSAIAQTQVTFNGTITQGSESITAKGFEYKAVSSGTWITIPIAGATLQYTLTGLISNTQYSVRAYASTATGTTYGAVINFSTIGTPGTGTLADPYKIYNITDLKALSTLVMNDASTNGAATDGKYWILMNDIDMAGVTDFIPIGGWSDATTNNYDKFFTGTFDGNGKKIINLTINKPTNSYVGLFGYAYSATIKSLGIESGNFIGSSYVGGLVGYEYPSTTIRQCYVKANVTGNYNVGGMVGALYSATIYDSYTVTTIHCNTQDLAYGGIAGNAHCALLYNCYAITNFSGNDTKNKGLLIGTYLADCSNVISNCFYREVSDIQGIANTVHNEARVKKEEEMKTALFAAEMNKCQSPAVWQYVAGGYPVLKWQAITGAADPTICPPTSTIAVANIKQTSATMNGTYTAGNETVTGVGFRVYQGTVSDPTTMGGTNYSTTIATTFSYNLNGIDANTDFSVYTYITTANRTYYKSGTFFKSAAWLGSGTAIDPYLISTPDHLIALSELVMKDVSTDGSASVSKYWKLMNDIDMGNIDYFIPIGGWKDATTNTSDKPFQGRFDGNGKTIRNLTINQPDNSKIGLFGMTELNAQIRNVGIVNCNYKGSSEIGGLVGSMNSGQVDNCYAIGKIEGVGYLGGLIGLNANGDISNCYANTSIVAEGSSIGGFIGYCYGGSISNSYSVMSNLRTTTSSSNKGLFAGGINFYLPSSHITNCYYSTAISGINAVGDGTAYSGLIGKTDVQLKATTMVATPSTASNSLNFGQSSPYPWKVDLSPNVNNGFPILSWQTLPPAIVTTGDATTVTKSTATLNGTVATGSQTITARGFEYKIMDDPNALWIDVSATGTGTTTANATGLVASTYYAVRAYATTATGKTYGATQIFATQMAPPVVSISNIIATAATINTSIVSLIEAVTVQGFSWKPSSSSTWTTVDDVWGDDISYVLTGLSPSTSYDIQFFVTTASGTVNSSVVSFSTTANMSSIPFSETFESGLSVWTLATSNPTYPFSIVSTGSNPTCVPHGGSSMLYYNAYNAAAGNWATIITPSFSNLTAGVEVDFWMYRDNGYSDKTNEGISVFVNSTPDIAGATLLGFAPRYSTTNGWEKIAYIVPNTIPIGSQYVIFKVVSEYGNNIYIDDINIFVPIVTPPTVTASGASSLTQTTATLNGSITAGNETITAQGFKWRVSGGSWTTINTTNSSYSITGLTANTTYEYQAFATTASGTTTSSIIAFTTPPVGITPPTVTASGASALTQTTATLNGSITAGNETITAQGFKWRVSGGSWTTINTTNSSYPITGLTANTTYEYQAFATTASGINYSNVIIFTTPAINITLPKLITQPPATNNLKGSITQGTETIITQGFEYKQKGGTVWQSVLGIPAMGNTFTANYTGLFYTGTYIIRAYATTASGTYYGNEVELSQVSAMDIIKYKFNGVPTVNCNPSTNGGFTFVSFEWYKNGVLIPNAHYPYIEVLQGDISQYSCIATTAEGNVVNISSFVSQSYSLGNIRASVYPNPVVQGNTMRVRMGNNVEQGATGYILTANGSVVKANIPIVSKEVPIDIAGITSGAYILQIVYANGETESVNFIVY